MFVDRKHHDVLRIYY